MREEYQSLSQSDLPMISTYRREPQYRYRSHYHRTKLRPAEAKPDWDKSNYPSQFLDSPTAERQHWFHSDQQSFARWHQRDRGHAGATLPGRGWGGKGGA